jgi:hypothetical protein
MPRTATVRLGGEPGQLRRPAAGAAAAAAPHRAPPAGPQRPSTLKKPTFGPRFADKESFMQMLYNSDSYTVVQLDVPPADGAAARGGVEIVDKRARSETFLGGQVAEAFHQGVQDVIRVSGPDVEALDAYIARFASLAPHPLLLH